MLDQDRIDFSRITPLRWIGGQLHAAFVAWRKMRRRRAAIAELRGLDDLLLWDMGITRGEIDTVVRDGKERPRTSHKSAKIKMARAV
jgi:uncharacterized protein YjiS (DUF1127 family)